MCVSVHVRVHVHVCVCVGVGVCVSIFVCVCVCVCRYNVYALYTTYPACSIAVQMVQVNGNLKVKLPPSKNAGKREVEFVEPSALGFIGECRLIESASSILELSVPHSTFTMTKTLDMKIISVEAT